MGNAHGNVINDHCVVISGYAIRLEYNEVAHITGLETYLAADQVINENLCVFGNLKANGGLQTRLEFFFNLCRRQPAATPAVYGIVSPGHGLFSIPGQFFGGAETVINMSPQPQS